MRVFCLGLAQHIELIIHPKELFNTSCSSTETLPLLIIVHSSCDSFRAVSHHLNGYLISDYFCTYIPERQLVIQNDWIILLDSTLWLDSSVFGAFIVVLLYACCCPR